MIYATEQQIVVTSVLIVAVAMIALFTGIWYGRNRGLEEAAEEQRWEREQAETRRTRPAFRWHVLSECPDEGSCPVHGQIPPEVAHEEWLAHEDQALTLANDELIHEWHHPPLKWDEEAVPGCPSCEARWETPPLEPTAIISPGEESTTAWTRRMAADMDAFLRDLIGGTDEQLREITR